MKTTINTSKVHLDALITFKFNENIHRKYLDKYVVLNIMLAYGISIISQYLNFLNRDKLLADHYSANITIHLSKYYYYKNLITKQERQEWHKEEKADIQHYKKLNIQPGTSWEQYKTKTRNNNSRVRLYGITFYYSSNFNIRTRINFRNFYDMGFMSKNFNDEIIKPPIWIKT